MREPGPLSIAFVESHPEQAAQVLGGLPAPASAAFLTAAAPRLAAAVVRHLSPRYAARCAECLDDDVLAALIVALGPQDAAGLMLYIAPARQAGILERLPVTTAIALRLLVGYSRDTAGACMDPFPLALRGDTTAGAALAALKEHDGEPQDVVFVVEQERRLTGMLSVARLLRAAPDVALAGIMRRPAPAVSALAPLASLRNHPDWLEVTALAVVERGDRLMGALRRVRVEAALARAVDPAPATGAGDALLGLGGAYWQVTATLAQLAVNLAPQIPAVARDREEHGNGR